MDGKWLNCLDANFLRSLAHTMMPLWRWVSCSNDDDEWNVNQLTATNKFSQSPWCWQKAESEKRAYGAERWESIMAEFAVAFLTIIVIVMGHFVCVLCAARRWKAMKSSDRESTTKISRFTSTMTRELRYGKIIFIICFAAVKWAAHNFSTSTTDAMTTMYELQC